MKQITVVAVSCIAALLFFYADSAWSMYNPVQGRFMQREPLGYEAGMNLYQRELSRPLVFVDPDGENPVVVVGFGLCLLLGGCSGPTSPPAPATGWSPPNVAVPGDLAETSVEDAHGFGTWTIRQEVPDPVAYPYKWTTTAHIAFMPKKDKVCCEHIVLIQAVRYCGGGQCVPSEDYRERATSDGWAIDTKEKEPYYPVFAVGSCPPANPAKMKDTPSMPTKQANTRPLYHEFKAYAFCMDKEGRDKMKVYSYLFWGHSIIRVDKTDQNRALMPSSPMEARGSTFDDIMDAWNKQAGKKPVPPGQIILTWTRGSGI